MIVDILKWYNLVSWWIVFGNTPATQNLEPPGVVEAVPAQAGGWNKIVFNVPSNQNHSVILWSIFQIPASTIKVEILWCFAIQGWRNLLWSILGISYFCMIKIPYCYNEINSSSQIYSFELMFKFLTSSTSNCIPCRMYCFNRYSFYWAPL